MTRPEQLRHLIDRCTVAAVKTALVRSTDVNMVCYVKPPTPLEDVAAILVNGDKTALVGLVDARKASFVSDPADADRILVGDNEYLVDSDYVNVLLVPPIYLIQAEARRESMERAIAVRGLKLCKVCRSICGAERDGMHFAPPINYADGCHEYCLSCWLGHESSRMSSHYRVIDNPRGDLLSEYEEVLTLGYHLAIMPVARLELSHPVAFPGMVCFYPPGTVELDALGVVPNREGSASFAERCSYASGIDQKIFQKHPLVVFPCWFDWEAFLGGNHQVHLEFIRSLSEVVDNACFNLIRYRQCPIEPVHSLPGKAGQTNTDAMMSGAMLFHYDIHEARIIGGDAFTHIVTRGLGLPLDSMAEGDFPRDGEVGLLVRHALALYVAVIESNNLTSKFVQCTNLLEYLASLDGDDFQPFKKTKGNIVKYLTNNRTEYDRIMDRLFQMFGKRDDKGRNIGYRTRIVHLGERLEDIFPSLAEREKLFQEIKLYMSGVIDHMIRHSDLTWKQYQLIRDLLGPPGLHAGSAAVTDAEKKQKP